MKKISIGITDCGKYDNYRKWIDGQGGDMEIVRLSHSLNNASSMDACDALVLSGGEDVNPGLYLKPEYIKAYHLTDLQEKRDEFEYQVIRKTFDTRKPLLGICRGLQITNVFLGGSLIPDIPAIFSVGGHGKINGTDQRHEIRITGGSLLQQVTGRMSGEVNSAHHQSVDQPADGLQIVARSEDLVVEAMEWKNKSNRSWMLLLQWHPERMADKDSSPFSHSIRNAFFKAIYAIE